MLLILQFKSFLPKLSSTLCIGMCQLSYKEQPHQLVDSLLKYKKYSILHILTQKPPISVFVKISKYVQWSCK